MYDEVAKINLDAYQEAARRLQALYEQRPAQVTVVRDPVNAENDTVATVTAVDPERGRVEVNEAPRFRWAHETGRQARDRMRGLGYRRSWVDEPITINLGSSNYSPRQDPVPRTPWYYGVDFATKETLIANYKAFIAMWGKVAEAHEQRVFMKEPSDLQTTSQVS